MCGKISMKGVMAMSNEFFHDTDIDTLEERLFRVKTDEEIEKEKDEYKREIIFKGFLPLNDEFNETMHSLMEVVESEPKRFIIEECIPACKELWSKNIYTFMVSDHLNEGNCWIEIVADNLSDENKAIFTQLEGEDVIKFSYHGGCVNFGVKGVGGRAQRRLLELAQKFEMQDVPYGEAYITVDEYLIGCGCYEEVCNPDYVAMKSPLEMELPVEQRVDYILQYDDWKNSDRSKKTLKVFSEAKVTKPLEEYFNGTDEIYDNGRVYFNQYHYKKHMNYVKSMMSDQEMKDVIKNGEGYSN